MLWIALHLPRLPLEIFANSVAYPSTPEPFAVAEAQRIAMCDSQAYARGVKDGMTLSAASALMPGLKVVRRDPAGEAAALLGVAAWASQFTPNIALEPAATVLLEVSSSLGLFKGLAAILKAQRTGLLEMGHAATIASAPTCSAASMLAHAGQEMSVDHSRLEHVLAGLPVALAASDPGTVEALSHIGVRTIGELLALPRDGVARRFGQELLREIDRALGRLPDPRIWYVPPARFKACIDLPAEASHADMLLFAAKRLILQLAGYLAGRAAGIVRFTVKLVHAEQRSTDCVIGLVAPSGNAEHFMLLLSERLQRIPLAEPVLALTLEADEIKPLPQDSLSLFHDATQTTGDWQRLIERLRARLGNESVQGLAVRAEHRPEQASAAAEVGAKINVPKCASPSVPACAPELGARPFWLLAQPAVLPEIDAAPQYQGPLKLLAGPERIESGWWDGKDVKRDYFVARTAGDAIVWIYRERQAEGRWYLHGYFA